VSIICSELPKSWLEIGAEPWINAIDLLDPPPLLCDQLRALLRYRRIPFDWVIMTRALRKQTEHLRPNLIPVLQYPDGTFRGETTTLAYDLEAGIRIAPSFPKTRLLHSCATF